MFLAKRDFNAAAAFVLLFFVPTVLSANQILNGSFEQGGYDVGEPFTRLLAGDTRLTDWTIGPVGVDWHAGHMGPPFDGLLFVDLHLDGGVNGTGTISQTFETTPDLCYEMSFHCAAADMFSDPRLVQVEIQNVSTVFAQPASPSNALEWGLHSIAFGATAATTTLTFSSPDANGFWGPLIDDVRVELCAATPTTPTTWGQIKETFGR